MDVLNDRPVAECFCAACLWFSMVGYEEPNKLYMEDGCKIGDCNRLQRCVQQCDFCYLGCKK